MGDDETTRPSSSPDELTRDIESELERAEVADDGSRLAALESVHERLENELEGDVDQAGTPRH